ncbi:MAG: hypothetical protein WBL95_21175 [Microcoleus sp.]
MKLCIVTHKVAIDDGQGRVNYEVAWEAIRRGHHVTFGVPRDRIRVILNGINLQEFAPGIVDRQKWGLPEKVPLSQVARTIA